MTGPTDPDTRAEEIVASLTERGDESERSRRNFLSRSVLAGGTLLALGGGVGTVLAQESDDESEMDNGEMAAYDDVEGTDIDVLNYALSLEHLENAFYRTALEMFDEGDFAEAEMLQDHSEVYSRIEAISQQEASHVELLTQAVEFLGGTPTEEVSYDFGFETVPEFLELAQVIENTGVAAYAGAAPFVESPDLLSAALSIHSVEARHAALLNQYNGASPFPDTYDPAQSQEEVLNTVSGFTDSGDGGDETPTPGDGNGTTTPDDGTATPDGNETVTPNGGNETVTPDGNTTMTPNGGNETP